MPLRCSQIPCFLFFCPFLKVFYKYVPRGMLSKSRPLARCHRWWRRAYKSRCQRVWCLGWGHVDGVDADLAGSTAPGLLAPSLAPWLLAPRAAPRYMVPRWCFNSTSNLPARVFFLVILLPLGFFLFPLLPTSRISILDLENFDLIHRSSRTRYHRSLLVFFSNRFGIY